MNESSASSPLHLHTGTSTGTGTVAGAGAGAGTRRSRGRGFTLVELSIVVAIVGILAVLAVVGYRRLIASSHLSEATGIVNGIRVAQESFHAETGYYANISGGAPINWQGGANGCPANAGTTAYGNQKFGWDPACGNLKPFQTLPLHIDTAVMYGYATTSNYAAASSTTFANSLPTVNGATVTATAPPGDWYVVSAVGDSDADGDYSCVLGTSATNQLFVQGDGN